MHEIRGDKFCLKCAFHSDTSGINVTRRISGKLEWVLQPTQSGSTRGGIEFLSESLKVNSLWELDVKVNSL